MTLPSQLRRQSASLIVVVIAVAGFLPQACARVGHRRVQDVSPIASNAPRKQSGTPAKIPPAFLDLVTTKKAFANLATVMPNGSPQVTPVWFDFDGTYIRVNSARGRVKDRNMRRDPRVALSILDPDNPYRYLAIRGRVIKITEDGAVDHINALAKKYRGIETYRSRSPGEVRVMYVIEPRRVAGQG
jgi:PPOX class probable F420-dependent enzyme